MSKYDGSIPWRAYETKLDHMGIKYGWSNHDKLDKLVEALEGKALNFFGTLHMAEQASYRKVRGKFEYRFGQRPPARTARSQLMNIKQETDESLEEFAERVQELALDAWGSQSTNMAETAAMEAFIHGVQDSNAAMATLDKDPHSMEQAVFLVRDYIHNHQSITHSHSVSRLTKRVNWPKDTLLVHTDSPSLTSQLYHKESANKARVDKLESQLDNLTDVLTRFIRKESTRSARRTSAPIKSSPDETSQQLQLPNQKGLC
jgi:hypothetical protein